MRGTRGCSATRLLADDAGRPLNRRVAKEKYGIRGRDMGELTLSSSLSAQSDEGIDTNTTASAKARWTQSTYVRSDDRP